jgi:hypothetical protein
MNARSLIRRFLLLIAILLAGLAICLRPALAEAGAMPNPPVNPVAPLHWLIHTTTLANIDALSPSVTYLDTPLLDDPASNADYDMWVTPNWNPNGQLSAPYNNHPIGVWYNDVLRRWAIVNQDGAAMAVGLSFNVAFAYSIPYGFCHPMTTDNTTDDYSVIDNATLNGNAAAVIILTHYAWGGAIPGAVDNHNVGVAYDSGTARWRIYTEDGSVMPTGQTYCGLIVSQYANAWMHIVTTGPGGNGEFNYTWLDNPATNHNLHALVFVTHNLGPTSGMLASNHALGAWFSGTINGGAWSIFNQDLAPVADSDYYNVFVIDPNIVFLPMVRR